MKIRQLLTLIALIAVVAVQGAGKGRHLAIDVRQQHIPVEQAPQYFSQWAGCDSKTTFTLVKDETDELGFRHQRYAQQYGSIAVDDAQLLIHSKQGVLTYVNGFVMTTAAAPAGQAPRRAAKGRELVVIESADGFVFAVKGMDPKTHDIIYTDVETGQVVKRLPTIYQYDGQTTAKGQSYYYGEQEMNVTKLADNRLFMTDSVRKIYTYDAANAPDTIAKKYENLRFVDTDGTVYYEPDSLHCKQYFDEVLRVAQTKRSTFLMQELTQMTLNLSDAGKTAMGLDMCDLYITCGDISIIKRVAYFDFPMKIVPSKEYTITQTRNSIRMNDTDTTIVMLVNNDNIIDVLAIAPTAEGGDVASAKSSGVKGCLTADATLKACGSYAVDIHWGMQRVYDFYKSVLGRNSYDNCGSPIINVINPRHVKPSVNYIIELDDEPNAYANSYIMPRMVYGRGDLQLKSDEQVELSTMAHEFTHLVTGKTADLEYKGESGALNEAFSDILGASVFNHVLNSDGSYSLDYVYALGQDSERQQEGGCVRSMKNPWIKQHPKALEGKYWHDPTLQSYDNGGVHINSNVLNFWFYLLAEGFLPGRDTLDDTVVDATFVSQHATNGWQGIGINKALQIAYRLLTVYLYKKADYRAAYNLSKTAAADLGYGESSTEYQTMMKCWHAVTPAGWTEATVLSLDDAITLTTSLKTTKRFVDNNSRLEPYTGTDLHSGIIELTATFSLTDAAKLRSRLNAVPKYLPAKCTATTLSGDSKDYNLSPPFKDFIGKVLNDPAITNDYKQDYTVSDTLPGGYSLTARTVVPLLHVYDSKNYTLYEPSTTYFTNDTLTYTVDNKHITFNFQMNSGYPMAVQPDETAGETINCQVYRVGSNGQETLLTQSTIDVPLKSPYLSYSYKISEGKYFARLFKFIYPATDDTNAPALTAGTYRLKVSSSWAALSANQFDLTVVAGTAILPSTLDDATSTPRSAYWYTLDGRRLSDKPIRKGLYIYQGKAVVIR